MADCHVEEGVHDVPARATRVLGWIPDGLSFSVL